MSNVYEVLEKHNTTIDELELRILDLENEYFNGKEINPRDQIKIINYIHAKCLITNTDYNGALGSIKQTNNFMKRRYKKDDKELDDVSAAIARDQYKRLPAEMQKKLRDANPNFNWEDEV